VSAAIETAAAAEPGASAVDDRNPWLGLASFTEETRQYFYGREEEVAELARRVQRKLLTVLFGQSGLGKTSILRAGLVPRLRGQGYCPVYVRIDYGHDAPEPAEQIKQAIARTARHSGEWTQVGVAVAGESLWEFLHHRDDVLRDESGKTLIPLLIFDQFEEIFTLAQSDDFGRARAARFIADLADLVENRPPKEFEARLEHDDAAAERFDFARSDYRVLIALREDYLAPLEGLKAAMPSVTQNRLRLAPMTGQQALAAVLRPGKGLVSEEVAAAMVRFVAGGAELGNAEVEPSLLSLICRELNDTRLGQGRSEISLDLLAGSHETILSNFYERSLADQPPAVRRIIEDELLTESGFRENVAEERVLSSFAAAGAAPGTLAILVNRRLLRIEERLDVRRVEITHDVLCGVVKQSRDLRHEREARDATERLLAEQRERARRTRQALIRARQVAAVCIVLALGAMVAAGFAYVSTQRARRAEAAAEAARAAADETNTLTEQARGQAEQLLGYLTEDFSRELEGFGRLDLAAELARRQVDYFKALPAALKGGDTTRNGALAMVYYAKAMRGLGKNEAAAGAATEAVALLEELQRGGDHSETVAIGLALGLVAKASALDNQASPEALPTAARAAALLEPIASAPKASLESRRAYVEAMQRLGFQQLRAQRLEESERTLRKAIAIAAASGARDLSAPDMTAWYVNSVAWLVELLGDLGRHDEARRIGAEASALGDRLLELRPTYTLALRGRQLLGSSLGSLIIDDMHVAEGLAHVRRAIAVSATLLKLDPDSIIAANNLAADLRNAADANAALGDLRQAVAVARGALAPIKVAERGGPGFILNAMFFRNQLAQRLTDLADDAAAQAVLADVSRSLEELTRSAAPGSAVLLFGRCSQSLGNEFVALIRADNAAASAAGQSCIARLEPLKPAGPADSYSRNIYLFYGGWGVGRAEVELGDFAAAERQVRAALVARSGWPVGSNSDLRDRAQAQTTLAIALARRGDTAAAAREIAPVLELHRRLTTLNHDDASQHFEHATALYAAALAEPTRRGALLAEATSLLAALPPQLRALRSTRHWQALIDAARSDATP
jgi:hypothetical protein